MSNRGEVHLVRPVSKAQSPCIRIPERERVSLTVVSDLFHVAPHITKGDTHICARGTSADTPAPPYTCIAQSTTLQAILAAATLIMEI